MNTLQRFSADRAAACNLRASPACVSAAFPIRAAARTVRTVASANRPEVRTLASKVKSVAPLASEDSTPDVYINEPKPLREGEQKRIISVFVADESGLINRVTGVFARRGANIESLAVGLTSSKALFTIVFTGSDYTVTKHNEAIQDASPLISECEMMLIKREMMLIKVNAPPGPARTEVLELTHIFRAKVNDVSDHTMTICVSGDPGKILAIQKVMSKFGVLEITRTGRVVLKRGEKSSEQRDILGIDEFIQPKAIPTKLDTAEMPDPIETPKELGVYTSAETVDTNPGVWTIKDILLETDGSDGSVQLTTLDGIPVVGAMAHTLNIEVLDAPGVLNQVTGVFSRRGYNIQSLAVGPSERLGMSRICMVVPGTPGTISKLLKQLSKLVVVQSIDDLIDTPFVNRELILIKVKCPSARRSELKDLCGMFRADIVDVSPNSCIVEILGKGDKMRALTLLLQEFGILEIARTGRIAMIRESGVDSKYLEKMAAQHVW
eukprot:gene17946-24349_t